MLSYRHEYHAGNHADVLKHLCLLALLKRLCAKPKPLCYFESHAGAGRYRIDAEEAEKSGEYQAGAARLLTLEPGETLLSEYLHTLRLQQAGAHYPGSPAWAQSCLRAEDQMILCERHPKVFSALHAWAGQDPRIHLHQRDGHEAARALLPPSIKRGLVVLDPAYEDKAEYRQCVDTVLHLRKHFRSASIALWYPRLPAGREQAMLDILREQVRAECLHVVLDVTAATGDFGMYGSGMLLIQPPWQTRELLEPALHKVATQLAPCPELRIASWQA